MKKFYPSMYKENVYDVNYKLLKEKGIKCLIFDLDNTLVLADQIKVDDKTKKLIDKLKKDFRVVIISNNTKKRVEFIAKELGCIYVASAKKPLTFGYNKIKNKYNYKKKEMATIGDQIVTDILGGNTFGITTVLVDPLGKKDLKVTYLNRVIERKILENFAKKNIMKKGEYYE